MLKNGILIFLVSLLSACGGSDSADSTDPATPASNTAGQATELEGSWAYSCQFDPDLSVYSSNTVTFAGNTISQSATEYLDPACTVVDDTATSNGTFTIGNTLTPISGGSARELNITISSINGNTVTINFYDIYQISGNTLYTGVEDLVNNSLSPSTRPVTLDFGLAFIKQ